MRLRGISRSAGLPPGTAGPATAEKSVETKVTVLSYDADRVKTLSPSSAEEIRGSIDPNRTNWIRITGLEDSGLIQRTCRAFDLHPLLIEDVFSRHQRPKLETSDESIFVTLTSFSYLGREDHPYIRISLILTGSCVISIEESPGVLMDGLVERILQNRGRIRRAGNDYLACAVLDVLVDGYFLILEQTSDEMEELEVLLTQQPGPDLLARIQSLRNEMLMLRKVIWPLRDVIGGLSRDQTELIRQDVVAYFRDVYDHTIQVIDTTETLREILAGMVDTYLSSISNRMNQVMQVLTIVATIFIPLTFIAGVYGMNFHHMPELALKWAYPAVLGLMALVTLGMLAYFRRKKWM